MRLSTLVSLIVSAFMVVDATSSIQASSPIGLTRPTAPSSRVLGSVSVHHPSRKAFTRTKDFGVPTNDISVFYAEDHYETHEHYAGRVNYTLRYPGLVVSSHHEIVSLTCLPGIDGQDIVFSSADALAAAVNWPMPMVLVIDGDEGGCFTDSLYEPLHVYRIKSSDPATRSMRVFGVPSRWSLEAEYHHISMGTMQATAPSTSLARRDAPSVSFSVDMNYNPATGGAPAVKNIFDYSKDSDNYDFDISLDCVNCFAKGSIKIEMETGSALLDAALHFVIAVVQFIGQAITFVEDAVSAVEEVAQEAATAVFQAFTDAANAVAAAADEVYNAAVYVFNEAKLAVEAAVQVLEKAGRYVAYAIEEVYYVLHYAGWLAQDALYETCETFCGCFICYSCSDCDSVDPGPKPQDPGSFQGRRFKLKRDIDTSANITFLPPLPYRVFLPKVAAVAANVASNHTAFPTSLTQATTTAVLPVGNGASTTITGTVTAPASAPTRLARRDQADDARAAQVQASIASQQASASAAAASASSAAAAQASQVAALALVAQQAAQAANAQQQSTYDANAADAAAHLPSSYIRVTGGLQANVDMLLTVTGEVKYQYTKTLVEAGIPELSIPKVSEHGAGPYFKLVATGNVSLSGTITVEDSFQFSWPDWYAILPLNGDSPSSNIQKPVFSHNDGPHVKLEQVQLKFGLFIEPQILFGIDVLAVSQALSGGIGFQLGLVNSFTLADRDDLCDNGIFYSLDLDFAVRGLYYVPGLESAMGSGSPDGEGDGTGQLDGKPKEEGTAAQRKQASEGLEKTGKDGKVEAPEEQDPGVFEIYQAPPFNLYHTCLDLTPVICKTYGVFSGYNLDCRPFNASVDDPRIAPAGNIALLGNVSSAAVSSSALPSSVVLAASASSSVPARPVKSKAASSSSSVKPVKVAGVRTSSSSSARAVKTKPAMATQKARRIRRTAL